MSTGKFTTPITANGTSQAAATPIVRDTNWTICMVTVNTSGDGVKLPDNANVGDIVEIHSVSSLPGFGVWPATGDQIENGGPNDEFGTPSDIIFRRTSAGNWMIISTFTL
jgi:hypothetical protein